jgi:hypothetical protein
MINHAGVKQIYDGIKEIKCDIGLLLMLVMPVDGWMSKSCMQGER